MFEMFVRKEPKVETENKEPEKESVDTTSYKYCLEKFKEENKELIESCEFKKSNKTGFCIGQTVRCMYEGSPKMTVSSVREYSYIFRNYGYRSYEFCIEEFQPRIETRYFNKEGNMITLTFDPKELILESN